MGVLNSFAMGNVSLVNAFAFPMSDEEAFVIMHRTKAAATYGVYFPVYICRADEIVNLGTVYINTGWFDNVGLLAAEVTDYDDNFLLINSKSETNLLGISGPRMWVMPTRFTSADYDNGSGFAAGGVTFSTGGIPDRTRFPYPAYSNGNTYYRYDTKGQTARISENRYVMFGTASSKETSSGNARTNFWAVRYTLGEAIEQRAVDTTYPLPTYWRTTGGGAAVQGEDGTLDISYTPFELGEDITIIATATAGPKPAELGPSYYYTASASISRYTYTLTSGSGIAINGSSTSSEIYKSPRVMEFTTTGGLKYFNVRCDGNENIYYWFATNAGPDYVVLEDFYTDTACPPVGISKYINRPISQAVFEDDHLYAWTADENGDYLQFDVDCGGTLSISASYVDDVPSRFDHENTRRGLKHEGVIVDDYEYLDRFGTNDVDSWDTLYSSYSADTGLNEVTGWKYNATAYKHDTASGFSSWLDIYGTLRSIYPVGHPLREHAEFGCFVARGNFSGWPYSNLYVVPWVYVPVGEPDVVIPLKMNQRDDGRGNSGGPGRIGYYGHNGGGSSRITDGGAW